MNNILGYDRWLSEDKCWLYNGTKSNGYGRMTIGSRSNGTRQHITVHRLSYLIFNGEIGNKCVLHKCDVKNCVNPKHLYLGDYQDNANDRENRNRGKYFKGENHPYSKHTQKQVDEIREKYKTGNCTMRQLAKEYEYKDHTSISNIINFKTWIPKPPKEKIIDDYRNHHRNWENLLSDKPKEKK